MQPARRRSPTKLPADPGLRSAPPRRGRRLQARPGGSGRTWSRVHRRRSRRRSRARRCRPSRERRGGRGGGLDDAEAKRGDPIHGGAASDRLVAVRRSGPRGDDRGENNQRRRELVQRGPLNARAAVRASSVACASTRSAMTTPRTASTASMTLTPGTRRTSRGSRTATGLTRS